jgi:hypothetical protein
MHEFAADLARLEDLFDAIAGHGPASTVDLATLWLDLVALRKTLGTVIDAVEYEATESLIAQVGEVPGKRSEIETPAGPVRLEREPAKHRSHGHAVARALSRELIDRGTGELIRAVPLDTLAAVIPAIAAQGETSYGWRWWQLRDYLGADYDVLIDETPLEDRALIIKAGWR